MNIPDFTAEASLYRTSNSYRSLAFDRASPQRTVGIPQLGGTGVEREPTYGNADFIGGGYGLLMFSNSTPYCYEVHYSSITGGSGIPTSVSSRLAFVGQWKLKYLDQGYSLGFPTYMYRRVDGNYSVPRPDLGSNCG